MTNHSFTFHVASEGDTDDILDVETRAFGYSKEARLVADLLNDESACPTLSLLARHNGEAVGLFYSPGRRSKGSRTRR